MASRYSTTKQIKDGNGRRRAEPTIFPVPPAVSSDTYIQITTPERLDTLANRFYGNSQLWWVIAVANGLGKGTLYIPENTRLRLPSNTELENLIEQTNNSR